MNISPEERRLLRLLAAAVSSRQVTQLQVAGAVSIHQSQISRILAGHARRSSSNVKKLCNYAESLIEASHGAQASDALALNDALKRIWDGSPAHAKALLEILRSVGMAQTTFQREK